VDFEYPAHEDLFKDVQAMQPFQNWCSACDEKLVFEMIMIQSIDVVDGIVISLKFSAQTVDSAGNSEQHVVWLTGASLHVMVVVTSLETRRQHAFLVSCPRICIGRVSLLELPMIGLDSIGNVNGVFAEMLRDLGLDLQLEDLVDLTHLSNDESLGIYTSPDSRDEFVRILLHSTIVPEADITRIYEQCGKSQDTTCKLHLLPLNELW